MYFSHTHTQKSVKKWAVFYCHFELLGESDSIRMAQIWAKAQREQLSKEEEDSKHWVQVERPRAGAEEILPTAAGRLEEETQQEAVQLQDGLSPAAETSGCQWPLQETERGEGRTRIPYRKH